MAYDGLVAEERVHSHAAIRQALRPHSGVCLPSTEAVPLPDMGVAHTLTNTLTTTMRDT
jgi:hypothetical protein